MPCPSVRPALTALALAVLAVLGASAARAQVTADSSRAAAGPGAGHRVSLGGYGEMHAEFAGDEREAALDRFVLFVGHEMSDRVRLYSELEVEDAEEVEMEQAYIEFDLRPSVEAEAGLVLVPLSRVNLLHEPPTYLTVQRPLTDRAIIPTTWRELGAGLRVTSGDAQLSGYALNALDAHEFTAATGIRSGRRGGEESEPHDLAVAGRAEWTPLLGVSLAASGYTGSAAAGDPALDGVRVSLLEADVDLGRGGWTVRAEGAAGFVGDAAKIYAATAEAVGSRLAGGYAQIGYDLLRVLRPGAGARLTPFAQFEVVDTQARVPAGTPRVPGTRRTEWTAGVSFRPVPAVALKADVVAKTARDLEDETAAEVGLGFMF